MSGDNIYDKYPPHITVEEEWTINYCRKCEKMKKTKKSLERKITYCTCHNARVVGGRKPEYFTKKLLTKHALLEKFPLCAIKLLIYVLWLKNYFCTFNEILKK